MTDTIEIQNLDKVTTLASDDYLVAMTDSLGTTVLETKEDFITDIISTDSGNLLESGTDYNLKTKSTITAQGNTFNGVSQLIQTTAAGYYPALNGSFITNVLADYPNAGTFNMPTLANNTTDANNDIDFSAGFCYDLTTNVKITNIALTKQLDAVFAEGTNAGGLDTGTKAISTRYYCFAISKANGDSDFLFSISSTAPTMPTGFVNKRCIGSIVTNSSGNIAPFIQDGDNFHYVNPFYDVNVSNLSTTAVLYALSCPPETKVLVTAYSYSAASSTRVWVSSPLTTSVAAAIPYTNLRRDNINEVAALQLSLFVNSSSQIRAISNTASTTFGILTMGYEDKRGAN